MMDKFFLSAPDVFLIFFQSCLFIKINEHEYLLILKTLLFKSFGILDQV